MGSPLMANRAPVAQPNLAWEEVEALEQELRQHKHALAGAIRELDTIHASHGWKLLRVSYRVCNRLLPQRSRRLKAARKLVRAAVKCLGALRLAPQHDQPADVPLVVAPPAAEQAPAEKPKKPAPPSDDPAYARWIRFNEPAVPELLQQCRARLARRPTVSIVVPAYNTPAPFLHAMFDSVLAQTYPHWELCVADGGSTDGHVADTLRDYAAGDPRIKVHFLGRNNGIAGNSNAAIALATGDYVALLDHDDTLAPFALFEVVKAINDYPDADFLYSDEDKLSQDGTRRYEPHFKPDWAPDTLRSHNYICHLSVYRRELLQELGGFRTGFDGSQDYDLILRATERAKRVVHIPQVLYHWRTHAASTAFDPKAKMYAYEAAQRALAEHLQRRGTPGAVDFGQTYGIYSIRYELPSRPLVSIVIPNRDQAGLLRRCVESVGRSTYSNYELVILENGSREAATRAYYAELQRRPNVRLLTWEPPFNYAAANNFAAKHAAGVVLLFLNNDIEALSADWLERMLSHALRSDVGAVGAKLYYPDGTIQHAGVVVGLGGVAGHMHHHFPGDQYGYVGRLITTQNYAAVTAACLMTRREVFEAVGGFDEEFILTFNDVDLCLRLLQKGWQIVWSPDVRLTHWESKTRGPDTQGEALERFIREEALFKSRWGDFLAKGDPYYSPHLTLVASDCAIRA
jgi:GT2 family glycosyltransferase